MTALSSNSPPPGAEPSVLDRLILKFRQVFFPGSGNFWETRYARGGDSGHGSQGRLAQFKAEVLNRFVEQHRVESVIEFGCGDGGQLALLRFPRYIGLDVAPTAIARCRERFRADSSKSFFLYHPFGFEDRQGVFRADLTISLDVIYHLVEDDIYEAYLNHLFESARRFVLIYASDRDAWGGPHARHVRHRHFTRTVRERFPEWEPAEVIRNPYPGSGNLGQGSFSDFHIFRSASW